MTDKPLIAIGLDSDGMYGMNEESQKIVDRVIEKSMQDKPLTAKQAANKIISQAARTLLEIIEENEWGHDETMAMLRLWADECQT